MMLKRIVTACLLMICLAIAGLLLPACYPISRPPEELVVEEVEMINRQPPSSREETVEYTGRPGDIIGQPLEEQIGELADEYAIDPADYSYLIIDLVSGDRYRHNHRREFIGASMYKLPMAMLYYDAIARGEFALSQPLLYEDWMTETGGPVEEFFLPGEQIELEYLLEVLIVASDNTAGHMLYWHYGGWEAMRQAGLKYTDRPSAPNYYAVENYLTANYMADVLVYLYHHRADYRQLLQFMSQGFAEDYLNSVMAHSTYQKTAFYDGMLGAAGLVLRDHPYAIVVFTELDWLGNEFIGRMNQLAYDYFNPLKSH